MSNIDDFITKPAAIKHDAKHHDNVRANELLGPRHKYVDKLLVPGGNLSISVREIKQVPPDYKSHVKPHKHDDWSEVYAVIGDDLTVEYMLGEETREVTGWSALFVPAGMVHSYRPIKGSGYMVFISRSGEDLI